MYSDSASQPQHSWNQPRIVCWTEIASTPAGNMRSMISAAGAALMAATSWASWRGPVALRSSLETDSIVDRRAAAAGRAARAPGGSAAQRPVGLGALVSGRDAAASLALNAATWCGAARVATAP